MLVPSRIRGVMGQGVRPLRQPVTAHPAG